MMTYYRHIYQNAPASAPLPPELHGRRVEVIVLSMDEPAPNQEQSSIDALGWPIGFFESTFGAVPDHPDQPACSL
ncbi:MAG: hypothetical protein WAU00_05465 [Caldilinea sp.]